MWQPIETAPRDGQLVWLVSTGELHIGYFDPPNTWDDADKGRWILKTTFSETRIGRTIGSCHHACKNDETPTAWMPLPPPPERLQGEG